ncbi:hypothetical protein DFJ77DRAFT_453599 [Powellomyces hirtus]|nr:hypothetical protein DFJ77DRAFT_453599 [Powellomyces hirtus]
MRIRLTSTKIFRLNPSKAVISLMWPQCWFALPPRLHCIVETTSRCKYAIAAVSLSYKDRPLTSTQPTYCPISHHILQRLYSTGWRAIARHPQYSSPFACRTCHRETTL